jgi:nitrogen fixation-related uncharacterized protein
VVLQAHSSPLQRITAPNAYALATMSLLLLEALVALLIALFIVWWTMFSGRRKPEADPAEDKSVDHQDPKKPKS